MRSGSWSICALVVPGDVRIRPHAGSARQDVCIAMREENDVAVSEPHWRLLRRCRPAQSPPVTTWYSITCSPPGITAGAMSLDAGASGHPLAPAAHVEEDGSLSRTVRRTSDRVSWRSSRPPGRSPGQAARALERIPVVAADQDARANLKDAGGEASRDPAAKNSPRPAHHHSVPRQEEHAMGSTRDVLDNHLRSFRERNLERILSDYAPGAVLFTPGGPLRGSEIGSFF